MARSWTRSGIAGRSASRFSLLHFMPPICVPPEPVLQAERQHLLNVKVFGALAADDASAIAI